MEHWIIKRKIAAGYVTEIKKKQNCAKYMIRSGFSYIVYCTRCYSTLFVPSLIDFFVSVLSFRAWLIAKCHPNRYMEIKLYKRMHCYWKREFRCCCWKHWMALRWLSISFYDVTSLNFVFWFSYYQPSYSRALAS